MARALHLLGLAAHIAGEYPAALAHYEPALAIRQDLGHVEGIGVCFNVMAFTACRQGDYATALAHARDGVRALRAVDSDWLVHNAVAPFATLAAVLGQPRRAARLAGAVQAYGESTGVRRVSIIQEQLDPAVVTVRRELGDATYETARREGWAMSLYEAMSEALTIEAPTAGGDTAHPARPHLAARPMTPAGLSPRENEVLRLIAAGRSSREIADELVLSVRTVERHITHIYEKIGARGRADETAYALKHGIA